MRAELTAPLSADTPVHLPPDMAPIPRFRLEELAKYDERGRTSYQNGIHTGEHVGTHFDAPRHWVTGADLEDVASVPATRLVAPAVVIDRTHAGQAFRFDPEFPVHSHILGAGKYGITQLQNLHLLPRRARC